jgi:hypothetical protein
MGRLANAALVMGRALTGDPKPGGPVPPFTADRLHFIVAVAGYLKEASVLLHKDHNGRGCKLLEVGAKSARPMPDFLSLDELLAITRS